MVDELNKQLTGCGNIIIDKVFLIGSAVIAEEVVFLLSKGNRVAVLQRDRVARAGRAGAALAARRARAAAATARTEIVAAAADVHVNVTQMIHRSSMLKGEEWNSKKKNQNTDKT